MLIKAISVLMVVSLLFAFSCKKNVDDDNTVIVYKNVENKSKYSDILSHHSGENCMKCHFPGGSGKGYFSIAGTVYDSTKIHVYPNRKIRLYTQNNEQGDMIAEIPVDGKGNFFTTDTIDFSFGLYVVLYSSNANSVSMINKTKSGQCSKCHGITQNNIWIK